MFEEFITKLTGVPQEIWQQNKDLCYLIDRAKEFKKDYDSYTSRCFTAIEPKIVRQIELDELKIKLNVLIDKAKKENRIETDIYIAQAIEIVSNDYWLLQRMISHNAHKQAICLIKQTIVPDAIDVGKRLLSNAIRKIRALDTGLNELDSQKVKNLKRVYKNGIKKIIPDFSIPNNIDRVHLILNAGRSTRMRTTIPKGVIYLNDKPIIQYTIEAGRNAGFEFTIVVLGFKEELNGFFLNEDIYTLIQPSVDGTAHGVICAYNTLKTFNGALLVSYSDMPFITSDTLQKLYDKHKSNNAVMTLLTTSSEKRPEFGKLVQNSNGNYMRIAQPRIEDTPSDQADAGFYCFKSPEFWKFLELVENANNRYEYYLTDIMKIISENGNRIIGYETQDSIETIGINRPEDLKNI